MDNFDMNLMLEPVLANVVKTLADFFGTTTDAVMANAPAFLAKYGWFVKISEMGWMYALVIVLAGLFCSGLFTILDDLNGTPAEFIEKHLKSVYLPDKSISDVMNETTFRQSNNNAPLRVSSQSLKFYTTFMENYSKKVEKAGGDIDNINDASNKAKQIVEKMVATNNTTQQQNSQTSQSNATEEQPKANNESFNLADTLLYYFTEEEKPKTTYRSANEPDPQSDNKDGGKEKKPDISKQITNYYKIAIQLLSAKLNLLSKARKISMDIIKNFGKTAAGESGNNDKKTDNNQSTENKSAEVNQSDMSIKK